VRYAYYAKLKARDKATYRRSDEVVKLALRDRAAHAPLVAAIDAALASEQRTKIEQACQALADAISASFDVPRVRVKVLSRRPSTRDSELHGLYDPGDRRAQPVIRVWMRTAQHKRVVAFRTFLRTLLHELCHHLDYQLLQLDDSFHTEGFFKRESSLFKQLISADERRRRR
jgi:hypothetical protein